MATNHMSTRAGAAFEGRESRTVMSYERELVRLRAALARDADVIHQRDELIRKLLAWRETASIRVATLTPRQRQVMGLVLAGHPSKNIAVDLGIAKRTVENHRASIMKKTGSTSIAALARLTFAAAWNGAKELDPLDQLQRIIDREQRCLSSRSATSEPNRLRKPYGDGGRAGGALAGWGDRAGGTPRLARHRGVRIEDSRLQGYKNFADRAQDQENFR